VETIGTRHATVSQRRPIRPQTNSRPE
jgi:hypothetical protein